MNSESSTKITVIIAFQRQFKIRDIMLESCEPISCLSYVLRNNYNFLARSVKMSGISLGETMEFYISSATRKYFLQLYLLFFFLGKQKIQNTLPYQVIRQ